MMIKWKDRYVWHRWFAWFPVRVSYLTTVWLIMVDRKRCCLYECYWTYRLPKKPQWKPDVIFELKIRNVETKQRKEAVMPSSTPAGQDKKACRRAVKMLRGMYRLAHTLGFVRQLHRLMSGVVRADDECESKKKDTATVMRRAFISQEVAQHLGLTDRDSYFPEPEWRQQDLKDEGVGHYSEHIALAEEVLNSAQE